MTSEEKFIYEVKKQFNAEVSDNVKDLNGDATNMLRMKYGLLAPQLTSSEKYLIQKEERKLAGINS